MMDEKRERYKEKKEQYREKYGDEFVDRKSKCGPKKDCKTDTGSHNNIGSINITAPVYIDCPHCDAKINLTDNKYVAAVHHDQHASESKPTSAPAP